MMAVQSLLCSSAISWCDWIDRGATSQLRYGLASAERYACGLRLVAKTESAVARSVVCLHREGSQTGVVVLCVRFCMSVSI
jgi:hypothetical protein